MLVINTPSFLSPGSKWTRRFSRLGWGLLIGISLLLFLMPHEYSNTGLEPTTVTYLLISIFLGGITFLLVGIGFVMLGHLSFFKRAWGVLLFIALLTLGMVLFFRLQQEGSGWLISHIALLFGMWGMASMVALGMAVFVYLVFQDKSVRLFALAFLTTMWLSIFYVRRLGAAEFLESIVTNSASTSFWDYTSLICLLYWVSLIGPFSLLAHLARLLIKEWLGERPPEP